MIKILWLLALASLACRLIAGRWPWKLLSVRTVGGAKADKARRLLGLTPEATRQDIIEAHRNLVAQVHPDRGGSSALVHEANDARDLLLGHLEIRSDK